MNRAQSSSTSSGENHAERPEYRRSANVAPSVALSWVQVPHALAGDLARRLPCAMRHRETMLSPCMERTVDHLQCPYALSLSRSDLSRPLRSGQKPATRREYVGISPRRYAAIAFFSPLDHAVLDIRPVQLISEFPGTGDRVALLDPSTSGFSAEPLLGGS